MTAAGGASPRLPRTRRASLRAVARLHGDAEPSDVDCDGATWDAGLVGAYRSLGARNVTVIPAAPSTIPVLRRTYQPPLAWALAVGLAALVLLLATAPSAALWETHGHLPVAQVLGVPNAPRSPAFVALARVWSLFLSPFASLDARLTLFALGVFAALAAALYLLAHRLVAGAVALVRGASLVPLGRAASAAGAVPVLAGVAALGSSGRVLTTGAPWALTATLLVAGAALLLLARDRAHERGPRRHLLAGAYLLILGSTSWSLWLLPLGCGALFAVRLNPQKFPRERRQL